MNSEALSDIIVIDTNVVSYMFKGDSRANLYKPHVEGPLMLIAAQTFAELELMPLNNNWGSRRYMELHAFLKNFAFVEANKEVCFLWAKIQAHARRIGRPISVSDTWIAATALAYDAPLVTHDPNDFKNVPGLIVITEK
ncbi:MAG TPA: PIN domain-containing protein [Pyrinomonadaceae bacterium]|nr:PIN domain-containing protein [Pyrinomonadaceae bacterium]